MAKKTKKKNITVKIEDDTLFIKNEDNFLATEIDGETVMMNTETGRYLGMDPITTDIWNTMNNDLPFGKLIEHLMKNYEVELDRCKAETVNILILMLNTGLLKLKK